MVRDEDKIALGNKEVMPANEGKMFVNNGTYIWTNDWKKALKGIREEFEDL